MATEKESQIVLTLTDGIVEGVVDETAGGAVLVSENTRLSARKGTLERRPPLADLATVAGGCGGIVPGCGDSYAAYFKPKAGAQRIVGSAVEPLESPVTGADGQNAYYPHEITDSGVALTTYSRGTPAVTYDAAGNKWIASIGTAGSGVALYVVVYGPDGELLVQQQAVASVTTSQVYPESLGLWVGLTTGYSGSVVVWWADDLHIYGQRLTVSGLDIQTLAGPTTLVTYSSADSTGFITADVSSIGGVTGLLLCRSTANMNDVSLRRVNQSSLNQASPITISYASMLDGQRWGCSVSYFYLGGTQYAACTISENYNAPKTRVVVINLDTSTTLWTYSYTAASVFPVEATAQPFVVGANQYLQVVTTTMPTVGDTFTSGPSVKTHFDTVDLTTGTLVGTYDLFWVRLASRGAYHQLSDTEVYPYYSLVPAWVNEWTGALFDNWPENIPIDPAITVMTPLSATCMSTIGRVGADVCNTSRYLHTSDAIAIQGDKLILTYKVANPNSVEPYVETGNTSRFVELDLVRGNQASSAADVGGASTIAAAYPAIWDGRETTDICTPHTPRIGVVSTGGTATNPSTGTFALRAIIQWTDAAGNLHRSPPSLPVSVTLSAEKPIVYVSAPLTYRNSVTQDGVQCLIYSTLNNGSIFYNVPSVPSFADGRYVFSDVTLPPDAAFGQLYSTGADNEPLLPVAPPSFHDVATIGVRQWAIGGEFRNRLYYTKPKETGVAFEWAAEQFIDVSAQYGRLVKVVELGGQVRVLAERGVWAIGGYGPDASGQGQGFSDPVLVADTGCRGRHTVIQVPGVGVLFQATDGRFALLGDGLKRFETIDVYEVGAPTIHLRECEVIYPYTIAGDTPLTGWVVYNWLRDAFTKWTGNGEVLGATATHQGDERSLTYVYNETAGKLQTLSSDAVDRTTTNLLTVTRGWILPEGPQGSCVIREAWVQLLYPEGWSHGLSVTVAMDYDTTRAVTRTWTATELDGLRTDGRVTVGVNLHASDARAIKVTLADVIEGTAMDHMLPVNLTVTYGASSGQRRRSLKQTALK